MIKLNKILVSEAVVRKCSVKKVFLESSQNSQESSMPENLFIKKKVFSREFCEISKNTYSNRTPLVAASLVGCNLFHKNEEWNLCKFFLKFNFVFTLLPYCETLIKNSKHAFFVQIDSLLQLNTYNINQPLFTCSNSSQLLVISLVKVKKSKGNYTVLFY